MDPLIIVGILVLVAVVAFFALRKKPDAPALPSERPEPKAVAAKAESSSKAAPAEAESGAVSKAATKREPEASAAPESPEAAAQPTSSAEAISEAAPAISEAALASAAPIAPAAPAEPEPEPTPLGTKKGREEEVAALKKGPGATRGGFFARLKELFVRKPELDAAALEEVEEILLSSDVGVTTTQALLASLSGRFDRGELPSSDSLDAAIRAEAVAILDKGKADLSLGNKPSVLLFVGVNGVGKTTTIGKLASKLKDEGKKVLLVAGDTYRAAAVIQLEAWGRRVGCDVLKGKDRADPSGVIFDAVKKGVDEGYDVVLCDTAGRLQTKTPLMDELAKMGRSVEKAIGRPADETLLVLDATTGQNAIAQAKQFGSTLPLSGIVLTKLDGTAKGGVILGIVDEQKVPVRYVGIGERVEDLRVFEAESFVEALFTPGDET